MPKPLKIALCLTLICLIFAPRGQILAQEGLLAQETTNYLPGRERLSETLNNIPSQILKFIKQGIPSTKEDWQGRWRQVSETFETLKKSYETQNTPFGVQIKETSFFEIIKNFFSNTINSLGEIAKNFYEAIFWIK